MPRLNVIILEQSPEDASTYRVALWADVPAARQARYAVAGKTSVWPGATTTDNAALASGQVAESIVTQRIPLGTGIAQIELFLQNLWTSYQAQINAANPWVRYGSTWDGTTWVVVNNG